VNYVQLAQGVHRWVRSGNTAPGSSPSGPTDTANPDVNDIVYFVNEAYQQIQMYHDEWLWMRAQGTFNLVTGTRTYSVATLQGAISRFEQYRFFGAGATGQQRYLYVKDAAATTPSQMPCWYLPYEEWRGYFDRLPRPSNSMPVRCTVQPDGTLEFDPTPAAAPSGGVYSIQFDYRKTPQTLVFSTNDTPEMPAKFHDLILWWAVRLFCASRSNSDALEQTAINRVNYWLDKIAAEQLPEMVFPDRYS